ncbi:MAG TPA: type I pantothenate kinase [Kofleriaceae bacterium]|nr:type I pantothenate kinase [Kofleriaceae bacterium]
MAIDPYLRFDRDAWSRLRANTPLTLRESDLAALRAIGDPLSLDEVEHGYLPLSRLLNLHVHAQQTLASVTARFLERDGGRVPYVIGIAGSVAVGKSTTARVLTALLRQWSEHPKVALVTTDGFLLPNRELAARGIMHRKGFPESYDTKALLGFLDTIKSGEPASAPVYSHLAYDVTGETIVIDRPDILVIEGVNVLAAGAPGRPFVSDFFDFSIYVDAPEPLVRAWFLERFHRLRTTAFRDPASYFHRYAALTEAEAHAFAEQIWETINAVNLRDNIAPTRERATLILEKAADHRIASVALRRI